MKFLPKTLLLITVSIAASGAAIADPAMDWIQKMSDAMRNLNYRGNFVYLHEGQLESMEISHVRDSSGEKERLISLNGEAREVLRDNQNLTCIWPSSRKVVVDNVRKNSFSPIFIPEDIARIEKSYEMKIYGKDRVANMDTVVVQINPRDNLRYGMKFWINEANGLMMRSSLINEHGQEVEQVMFTSIELFEGGEILVLDTISQLDDSYTMIRFHSGDSSMPFTVDNAWQLATPPSGFWRDSALKRKSPGSEYFVQQMVYTDGLASLSVFIERHTGGTPAGSSSMGAVNAYIRILNDHSITAIGEVPAITVRQVAESITYQEQ